MDTLLSFRQLSGHEIVQDGRFGKNEQMRVRHRGTLQEKRQGRGALLSGRGMLGTAPRLDGDSKQHFLQPCGTGWRLQAHPRCRPQLHNQNLLRF